MTTEDAYGPHVCTPHCTPEQHYVPNAPEGIAMSLYDDLTSTLNAHSAENGSNTPDGVLAEYLLDCLAAFNKASQKREQWYGRALSINADDAPWVTTASAPQMPHCPIHNEPLSGGDQCFTCFRTPGADQ